MNRNREDGDPRNVWQGQQSVGVAPSAEEIHWRAMRSRQRAARQRRLRIGAAAGYLLSAIAVLLLGDSPLRDWIRAVGVWGYVILLAQMPAMAAAYASRQFVSLGLGARAPTCCDFYRTELELRSEILRQTRLAMAVLGPFGLLLLLLGQRNPVVSTIQGAAMIIVSVVWYFRAKREAPRLELELRELNAFRRSGP